MAYPALTLIQSFQYRGAPEEFSNQYQFFGPQPTSDATWKALCDKVIAQVKTIVPPSVTFVRAYGYSDPAQHAIWSHDYTIPGPPVAGTFVGTGGLLSPGDAAMVMRFKTNRMTSKGKVIYLRKYWHGCYAQAGADGDAILAAQKTALTTLGVKLTDGSIDPAFKLCDKYGVYVAAGEASNWITTRTLKRRGKRPPT